MKLLNFLVVSITRVVKTALLGFPLLVVGEFVYSDVLTVTCLGDDVGRFNFPMSQPVIVTNKMQRLVLPLQANLYDQSADIVTPADLVNAAGEYYPPVVQVTFVSNVATAEQCTALTPCINPYGQESVQLNDAYAGNVFVYKPDSQEWRFNLAVRDYIATGTYTITMISGKSDLYEFSLDDTGKPETCTARFIRE